MGFNDTFRDKQCNGLCTALHHRHDLTTIIDGFIGIIVSQFIAKYFVLFYSRYVCTQVNYITDNSVLPQTVISNDTAICLTGTDTDTVFKP